VDCARSSSVLVNCAQEAFLFISVIHFWKAHRLTKNSLDDDLFYDVHICTIRADVVISKLQRC